MDIEGYISFLFDNKSNKSLKVFFKDAFIRKQEYMCLMYLQKYMDISNDYYVRFFTMVGYLVLSGRSDLNGSCSLGSVLKEIIGIDYSSCAFPERFNLLVSAKNEDEYINYFIQESSYVINSVKLDYIDFCKYFILFTENQDFFRNKIVKDFLTKEC